MSVLRARDHQRVGCGNRTALRPTGSGKRQIFELLSRSGFKYGSPSRPWWMVMSTLNGATRGNTENRADRRWSAQASRDRQSLW